MPLMFRKIYFVMKMEQENLTRALCALHVSTKISQILFKSALNVIYFFTLLGETNLSAKFDVIRVDLQASEQFKSVSSFSLRSKLRTLSTIPKGVGGGMPPTLFTTSPKIQCPIYFPTCSSDECWRLLLMALSKVASVKKPYPMQDHSRCRNHDLIETKMVKIDTIFLTKTSGLHLSNRALFPCLPSLS